MPRVVVSLILLFVVALAGAPAQSLSVDYLEGTVEAASGTDWIPLSIGDIVAPETSLRLEAGSSVELSASSSKFTLTQPGTYSVRSLLSASRDLDSSGVGKLLARKVTTFLSGPAISRSDVAGIRGERAPERPGIRWEVDDAATYLEAGKRAIEERDYDRALLEFRSAREYADASQAADVAFYLAYSHSLKGDLREALRSLSDTRPDPDSETSGGLVLLKGQLLVETYAFRQAVDWLSDNASRLGESIPDRQLYFMLMAVGYRGLGDSGRSKENLTKVIDLGASTDIGAAAAELLQRG